MYHLVVIKHQFTFGSKWFMLVLIIGLEAIEHHNKLNIKVHKYNDIFCQSYITLSCHILLLNHQIPSELRTSVKEM